MKTFIRGIQVALERAGLEPGPVDGIFGKQTQAAVSRARAACGLAPRTGIDLETLAAVKAYADFARFGGEE